MPQMSEIRPPSQKFVVLGIILLSFVSRLPQLTSPLLILDGDESVVGIMAKHTMEGRYFPMFFLGQKYGLSTFEALIMIPFYWVFGVTTIAVKLAMLCLWTTGVIFFYKVLTQVNKKSPWIPVILTCVLIMTPAWAIWSMKARGGYLSAFLLSSVAMYMLFNERMNKRTWVYACLGVLIVLVYECQPLWIPVILPLYAYRFLKDKQWKPIALSIAIGSVLFFAFDIYRHTLFEVYKPQLYIAPKDQLAGMFTRIPDYLFRSLHGYTYFADVFAPDVFSRCMAVVFGALVAFIIGAAVVFVLQRPKPWLFLISVVCILFTLYITTHTFNKEARYLLPITGETLLCLSLLLNTVKWSHKVIVPGLIFSIAGIGSMISFKNFKVDDISEKEFREALNTLEKENVKFIYCVNGMLPWQAMFYSNEKIIGRGIWLPGRYPPHTERIDSALFNGGRTAVFGNNNIDNDYKFQFKDIRIVGHYYVCEYPNIDTLRKTFYLSY